MTSTAIKTAGIGSTNNTAHLNLTVTLAAAWAKETARRDKYGKQPRKSA